MHEAVGNRPTAAWSFLRELLIETTNQRQSGSTPWWQRPSEEEDILFLAIPLPSVQLIRWAVSERRQEQTHSQRSLPYYWEVLTTIGWTTRNLGADINMYRGWIMNFVFPTVLTRRQRCYLWTIVISTLWICMKMSRMIWLVLAWWCWHLSQYSLSFSHGCRLLNLHPIGETWTLHRQRMACFRMNYNLQVTT